MVRRLDRYRGTQGTTSCCAGSRSFPFDENRSEAFQEQIGAIRRLAAARGSSQRSEPDVAGAPACVVVCRRGNDSQRAVRMLREGGVGGAVDVVGGLAAWSRGADVGFPAY